MKIHRFVVFHFALIVLCISAFLTAGKVIGQDDSSSSTRYKGLIRESDLRVSEIRENLISGRSAPEKLRLRYAGKRGDFLEFYDIVGQRVYYRYREDRFDLKADDKINHLLKGDGYRVTGAFQGVLLGSDFAAADSEKFSEYISNNNSIPVYLYLEDYPLRMEEILFQ